MFYCIGKLGELVTLIRWFYFMLPNKALYLTLKVKKERGRTERHERAIVREPEKKDSFTFLLSEIIYFHSMASLFVIPLVMWLHIDWLCFCIQNCYHVTFKIWHTATEGSTVPPSSWFV